MNEFLTQHRSVCRCASKSEKSGKVIAWLGAGRCSATGTSLLPNKRIAQIRIGEIENALVGVEMS